MRTRGLWLLLIAIAALWLILANQRFLSDVISYWTYQPSSEIAAIAERVDFSDKGQFYFYTSRPILEPTQEFNRYCGRQEPNSAILGCYNGKIYIFDVDSQRLDGIEEVTAAHEMLHAAYDRMSESERQELASLLETDYQRVNSPALNERMEYYARTEPGQRTNELYAILGTEIADLSDELESHYKDYFNNRASIVALHQNYQSVFNELELKSATTASELDELAASINSQTALFNQRAAQLDADIRDFNVRAQAGYFRSESEFNAERSELVSRSNELEQARLSIESDIERYNFLLRELQETNQEAAELRQKLDSSLAPAPAL